MNHREQAIILDELFASACKSGRIRLAELDQAAATRIAAHLGLVLIPDRGMTEGPPCQANEMEVCPEYRTGVTLEEIFFFLSALLKQYKTLPGIVPYPSDAEYFWKLVERGRQMVTSSNCL
ncbi:MAG: hypothetical protein KDD15_08395 [Lewinella sp.]|nr:hypothetical protein [Lewinella sp.]